MKKYTSIFSILIIIVFFLALSNVASAAWWNPLSWFKKTTSQVEIPKSQSQVNAPANVDNSGKKLPMQSKSIPNSKIQNKVPAPQQVQKNKVELLEANKSLSNRTIIAKVKPAVVYIETESKSGSGMVIESTGYILTNAHVVSDFNTASITLSDGRKFIATITGRDENIDLALLKIDATGLPIVLLGDSNSIEQGDPVFALGYPLGIEGDVSFKDGTLSRRLLIDGVNYLEISAQILPGNSGGPLVDEYGNVVGVNTLSIGTKETLKFALPINIARNIIPDLKNGRNIVKTKIVPILQNPAPQPQEDSSLKIARCQAKRDADYSTFVGKADQILADAVQKIKDEAKTFIDEQLRLYDACLIERPGVLKQYDSTMSPYDLCSFYLRNAEAKKTYTDQLVAKTRASQDTFLPQGKAVADNEYYQCVSK